MNETDVWFAGFEPNTSARFRLFYFPHAGSGVAPFRKWLHRIDGAIDLRIVQPPGRGSRMRELGPTRMAPLVDRLGQHIGPLLDLPFIFFGHSLGALVAYETLRVIERPAEQLVVAAFRAPHLPLRAAPTYQLSDDDFLDEMRRATATPPQILENEKMVRLFMPALRRDAELGETYRHVPGPPLGVPITALHAARDPSVTRSEMEAWAQHTVAGFDLHEFDDEHFFIFNHIDAIAGLWRWPVATGRVP